MGVDAVAEMAQLRSTVSALLRAGLSSVDVLDPTGEFMQRDGIVAASAARGGRGLDETDSVRQVASGGDVGDVAVVVVGIAQGSVAAPTEVARRRDPARPDYRPPRRVPIAGA